MSKLIKLTDLNRNTRIDVKHLGLKYNSTGEIIKELNFHHIDGMYSCCTDDKNNVINLKSNTEVKYIGKIK